MAPKRRFEDVTETTGIPLSSEAASMMYTRYTRARSLAAGRRVLELGCGAGQGLGLLRSSAECLVGADYSQALLRSARRHYGSRVPLVRLSADALPFRTGAFGAVIFFEATYYVLDMETAFNEISRVLASGGTALFANANPERPDFVRSRYSVHYHSADEFRAALERRGFRVEVSGAFPIMPGEQSAWSRGIATASMWCRKALEALGLIPKTLKGRARLKRLVYGRLLQTPAEITDGFAEAHAPERLAPGPVRRYKVIYIRGDK